MGVEVLGILVPFVVADGGTRLLLLSLVIVAILLLIAGGIIALLTLRSQRKAYNTATDSSPLESERI